MMPQDHREEFAAPYVSGVQADDEDDPAPLRSWRASDAPARERRTPFVDPRPPRHQSFLAVTMIVLGALGIASAVTHPRTATELVLGGFLVVLGLGHGFVAIQPSTTSKVDELR